MPTATPVYMDDWIQLYLGNCKDIIWDIPFHTVDAVITDPPYLITAGNITWDGGRNYINIIGEDGFADSFDPEIIDFIHDNLLKRTNMLFFCNREQFEMYMSWTKKHKKNFQLLSWHKPDAVPLGNLWLPDTEYMFHIFKDLGYLNNKQSQHTYYMHNVMHTDYGHPCLYPDTPILTIDEVKLIKDINIGDKVLSEDGKFHSVIDKTIHPYKEELYEIEVKGTNMSVLATHNHPFLIYRPIHLHKNNRIDGCIVKYLNAESIRVGDYTMTPILPKPTEPELDNYTNTYKKNNDNFWFIAGLWLAEGSLQKAGHGDNLYPVFSLHEDETDLVDLIKTQTNKEISIYKDERSKGIHILVFDSDLALRYKHLFSTGAKTKKLNQKIFYIDDLSKENLLNGYLAGDGSIIRGDQIAKTASRTLALQLKLLGDSLGYHVCIYEYIDNKDKKIEDRTIKAGTICYQIYFYNGTRDHENKSQENMEITHCGIKYRLNYVKDIYQIDYDGDVINLTVEDSPTFLTTIGMSHNTVKPEKIITQLILQLTNEGDTIIDPFVGTGTTAVCAKRLGRKCIGIEIKEKYMDIAITRCKQAGSNELQPTMF
jgi:DNA modification methylase